MKLYLTLSLLFIPCFFLLPFVRKDTISKRNTRFDLAAVQPLEKAYAHNDYWHSVPLWNALSQGYLFIEVDVHLRNGCLYVAHNGFEIDLNKTLTSLYLSPLFELYKQNEGKILPLQKQPLCLMIDIKTDPQKTYEQLKEELAPFRGMLSSWEQARMREGPVSIILSGNRPIEFIAKERKRYVCLDGRLSDLGKGYDSNLMPIISERFSKISWRTYLGYALSSNEKAKIIAITKVVHAENKKLRFWGTIENETLWKSLLQAGVDLINTDNLEQLRMFLKQEKSLLVEVQ